MSRSILSLNEFKLTVKIFSKNKISIPNKEQKHLVETVDFDDLVDFMPSNYKFSLIKIDFKGFQQYAFQYSN